MWRIRQGGSRSARGVGGFPVCRDDESWSRERARRGQVQAGTAGIPGRHHQGEARGARESDRETGGPTSGGWTGKEVLAEGPVVSVQKGGPHWPFQGLQGHG